MRYTFFHIYTKFCQVDFSYIIGLLEAFNDECLLIYSSCHNDMKTVTSNSGKTDNNNNNLPEDSMNNNKNEILDDNSEQELLNPVNGSIHESRKNIIISVEELLLQMIDGILIINGDEE